jgi:hypothetical protein
MNKRLIFPVFVGLITLGLATRLLPHLPNATALTAIAFTSSVYLGTRWSLLMPVLVLFLSDLVIGFYDWRIMASVYFAFLVIGGLSFLSRKYKGFSPMFLSVSASSVIFFLITNTAVWAFSPWYEKSLAGLLYAYELGVPFFRYMLLGDLGYVFVLFGLFELVRFGVKEKVQQAKLVHR